MNFGTRPSRVEAVERCLHAVDAHAVGVHLDLDDVGLVGAEDRYRAGIGRRLGDHDVAGVEQRLAHEVDDLLAAGGDEQVVGLDAAMPSASITCDDAVLELVEALRRPVLERRARRRRRPTRAISAAKSSAGNVLVSGRPPASEMTSGRAVTAIRSRIAEDFMPWVRRANSPA